ncbi:MAG: DNA/RNA non-specific endonuclease [Bacteroidales bacterium]
MAKKIVNKKTASRSKAKPRKSGKKNKKSLESFFTSGRVGLFILLLLLFISFSYLRNSYAPVSEKQYVNDFENWAIPETTLDGYTEQIIANKGYTVSYNPDFRNPNWVAYVLERNELKGSKSKRTDKFTGDPSVAGKQATNADYSKSGYDRGHLAPAADMAWSEKSMAESFYFSNMSPQLPGFNRGKWKDLEDLTRRWADKESLLLIATGPVLKGSMKKIGKNQVAVPKYFYKVIIDPVLPERKGIGFVMENTKLHKPLRSYAVTIDSVERLTGINFFESLPDEIENNVESELILESWEW